MIAPPNQIYTNPEAYALEVLKQKLSFEAQKASQQSMLEYKAMKSFLGQGQMIFCIPCGGFGGESSEINYNLQSPMQCSMTCQPSTIPSPQYNANQPPMCGFGGGSSEINYNLQPPMQRSMTSQPNTMSSPQYNANQPPIPLRSAQTTLNFQQTPLQTSGQPAPPLPPLRPLPPPPIQQTSQQSSLVVSFRNTPQKHIPFQPGVDDCSLGQNFIEIAIDLNRFMPAEVNLNLEERLIEIRANHSDAQGNKTFSRRYDLPAAIIVEATKCVLSHDGILYVCAPWHKMEC